MHPVGIYFILLLTKSVFLSIYKKPLTDRKPLADKKVLADQTPLTDKKPLAAKKGRPMADAAPKKRASTPKAARPQAITAIPLKKGMDRYRIEVGRTHGVRAGDIVGAISNEAGLDSKYIKGVDINQDFSFVDLPSDMPKDIFKVLENTWVRSQQMSISKHA